MQSDPLLLRWFAGECGFEVLLCTSFVGLIVGGWIIIWSEVRVLPAPPRSPAQTGISRFSANRPELAAICARILSLQSADWIEGSVSGSLSLPWKIAFPDAHFEPECLCICHSSCGSARHIMVLVTTPLAPMVTPGAGAMSEIGFQITRHAGFPRLANIERFARGLR
jgi:hypothetical protein